jgi:riboflavin synthase
MFTGIVERTGKLVGVEARGGVKRITIEAPELAARMREGDSLAVNGVCLTALDVNPNYFFADLAAETLAKTTLGEIGPGALVNLELPTAAGSPLGGHIVQGHVDGRGELVSLEPVVARESKEFDIDTTDWTMKVRVPVPVRPWMVLKGSVALDGVSLTIADFDGEVVTIAILPLTYHRTNLHAAKIGDGVNVEADVLVKLAHAQMMKKPELELTEAWLVANGY